MILTILLWIIITFFVCIIITLLAKKYGHEYLVASITGLIIIANILANKIVQVGPFSVPGGVIVFSMTFLLSDILSEFWGEKIARKAVWTGFVSSIVLIISLWIVLHWQAAPFATEQAELFQQVLQLTPRITIAGLIAYLISQHHDVWAFHFWKRKTKGNYLWLRNNASTIISQLLDSTIFVTIAFAGILPILPLIIGQYVVKILIAIMDTPMMYLIRIFMKSVERETK